MSAKDGTLFATAVLPVPQAGEPVPAARQPAPGAVGEPTAVVTTGAGAGAAAASTTTGSSGAAGAAAGSAAGAAAACDAAAHGASGAAASRGVAAPGELLVAADREAIRKALPGMLQRGAAALDLEDHCIAVLHLSRANTRRGPQAFSGAALTPRPQFLAVRVLRTWRRRCCGGASNLGSHKLILARL